MNFSLPFGKAKNGARNTKAADASARKVTIPTTQDHVLLRDVREQIAILKTGDMAALIEVEGIDFARQPDAVRAGLVAQFENFLNTLRFPYQFTVGRRRQPLEEYLAYLEDVAAKHIHAGRKLHARFLYENASFMLSVTQHVNPQIPHYLITIPYDPIPPDERARRNIVLTRERYQRGNDELAHRCDQVTRALARVGLTCRRLSDEEIAVVMHRIYHPNIPDYRVPPIMRLKSYIQSNEGRG